MFNWLFGKKPPVYPKRIVSIKKDDMHFGYCQVEVLEEQDRFGKVRFLDGPFKGQVTWLSFNEK
jgi:hypothetical protein